MTDAENSHPLKQKLHQAARRLKTVRTLCVHNSTPKQIDVSACLDSVNELLDDLCNKLKSLATLDESQDVVAVDRFANPAPERHDASSITTPENTIESTPIDTSELTEPLSPRLQLNVAADQSPDCEPGTGPAPSLEAILSRLRAPSDTDLNLTPLQNFKSLSDEDLLGLEMISLAETPPSIVARTGSAIARDSQIDSQIESDIKTESECDSTGEPHDQGPCDPVAEERPPSPSQLPEKTEGETKRNDDKPKTSKSGQVHQAALIYESALDGNDELFSVAPVSDSIGAERSATCGKPETPNSSVEGKRDGTLIASETDEDQDAYVRSTIKGSNLEKLEALRQQLQRVFEEKAGLERNTESPAAKNHPGARSAPQADSNAPQNQTVLPSETCSEPSREALAEDTPDTNEYEPNSQNNAQDVTGSDLLSPSNPKTNEPDQGENMTTTSQSGAPAKFNDMMTSFASAAFLEDLQTEEANEKTPNAQAPLPGETMTKSTQAAQSPPPASRGETEEDVQDYMHGLMTRLRGGAYTPPPASAPKTTVEAAPKTEAAPAPASQPEFLETLKEEEFVPKSQAPEKSMNLGALRDLANQSTRSAVKVFKQNEKKALYATQLAGIAGGTMGAMVFGLLGSSLGPMFYVLAAICLVGAGFAGYRFALDNVFNNRNEAAAPKS